MNQKHMKTDEAAQVGIGTMIVFIATILVAAVAAGVLIDTSQKLQDKSTRTGNDAVSDIASSLTIEAVYGYETATADTVGQVSVMVSLAAGADPVDLQDLVIQFHDGTKLVEYAWYYEGTDKNDQNIGTGVYTDFADNRFWIDPVRDTDGSAIDVKTLGYEDHVAAADDVYTGVLNEDDIVMLSFAQYNAGAADSELDIGASSKIAIVLLPDTGISSEVAFTTPISMSGADFWELA